MNHRRILEGIIILFLIGSVILLVFGISGSNIDDNHIVNNKDGSQLQAGGGGATTSPASTTTTPPSTSVPPVLVNPVIATLPTMVPSAASNDISSVEFNGVIAGKGSGIGLGYAWGYRKEGEFTPVFGIFADTVNGELKVYISKEAYVYDQSISTEDLVDYNVECTIDLTTTPLTLQMKERNVSLPASLTKEKFIEEMKKVNTVDTFQTLSKKEIEIKAWKPIN